MGEARTIYRVGEQPLDNLHISVRCPQCEAPPLPERMEQKFFIAPKRMGLARALLLRTCRVDPVYPVGQINSVYFDTIDLDQHERSSSGELVKDKVRIRWYGDEYDPHSSPLGGDGPRRAFYDRVTVWLELKSRRGFSSTKQRLSLPVSPDVLAYPALSRGIVPASMLLQTMAGFGFFPPGPIGPVIVISYIRLRFVEPLTGYRISLDSRVRSSLLVPGRDCTERGLELPGGLVEVKCPVFHLPPALRELDEIGSSWSRYSKYSACIDGHEAGRGTVSRLWPSGLIEGEPGALARVWPKAKGDRPPEERDRKPRQEPTRRRADVPVPAPLLEDYETE